MSFEFIKRRDPNNRFDITEISVRTECDLKLPEMIKAFEDFLRAVGYIVEHDELQRVDREGKIKQ